MFNLEETSAGPNQVDTLNHSLTCSSDIGVKEVVSRQSESASSSMLVFVKKINLPTTKKSRGGGEVWLSWRVQLCVTNICGRLFLPHSASKVCANARSKENVSVH